MSLTLPPLPTHCPFNGQELRPLDPPVRAPFTRGPKAPGLDVYFIVQETLDILWCCLVAGFLGGNLLLGLGWLAGVYA